jgi:hypothetical protein
VPCRLVVYLVSLPSSVPTIDCSALSVAVDHATSQRCSEIWLDTIDFTAVCDYFRVLRMYARRVVHRRVLVKSMLALLSPSCKRPLYQT